MKYNSRMKRTNKKTKAEALTQILILTIAIFAISWMIGSEIEEVSALDDGDCLGYICKDDKLYWTKLSSNNEECIIDDSLPPAVSCDDGCIDGSKSCILTTQQNNGGNFENLVRNIVNEEISQLVYKTGAKGIKNLLTKETAEGAIVNVLSKSKALEIYNAAYDKGILANWGKEAAKEYAQKQVSRAAYDAAIEKGLGETAAQAAADAEVKALGDVGTYSLKEFLFGNMNGIDGSWTGVGGGTNVLGAIGAIVVWSAIAFAIGRILGPKLGLDVRQSQILGYSLAAGTAAGLLATSDAIWGGALAGPIGLLIGVAVAFAIFAIFAKKTSVDIIQYNCLPWDAQSGRSLTETQMRDRCKLCNSQKDFVCTEYQCRSLGQGCVLIEDEETGKGLCIWNNTNDITPPIINAWKEALLEDFKYVPDTTLPASEKGVKITYTGSQAVTKDGTTRCAPPFTKVSFGVELDEPAKCKISPLRLRNYSIMADVFMGSGIREYNHSFALSMPSQGALEAENYTVDNGGKYEFYVRCEDANGNSNIGTFVFKFCISQGPDTTPPKIEGSSLYDNQPISFGQRFTDIELYVNEPAECRWSTKDQLYETMENNMTCATNYTEMNAQMLYTCRGNLTELKDGQQNKFYFRCKDQPYLNATRQNERNANRQSYVLTLIGTVPLRIVDIGPTGIIESPTNIATINLTVETDEGFDDGNAICAFSETGASGSYIDFFYGYDVEPFSSDIHSQQLGLEKGNYTFFVQCRDKSGNRDETNVSFGIEVDDSPPNVVRIYKEDDYLKLITDEFARCVYQNQGCNYLIDDGIEMDSFDGIEHYVEWDVSKDFYIKCEDEYGKSPLTNQCSITARPFEIVEISSEFEY